MLDFEDELDDKSDLSSNIGDLSQGIKLKSQKSSNYLLTRAMTGSARGLVDIL